MFSPSNLRVNITIGEVFQEKLVDKDISAANLTQENTLMGVV